MQNTDASEPVTRFKATGINIIVAAGLVAAIGDIRRLSSPQKLVSYVGLNPRVRQSGLGLAQHGRISKRGRSHARAMSQTRRKLPPTAQR
jgi:transposase